MRTNLLESQIDRELKKIDPDLFLDKHFFEGHIFYSVRYMQGAGKEPLYVITAEELSWDIPAKVRAYEGDIQEAIAQVKTNNAVKKEMARQERNRKIDELAAEHNAGIGKLRRWYIPGVRPL